MGHVVTSGNLGLAMYIITSGAALKAKGHQWTGQHNPTFGCLDHSAVTQNLLVGDSFGEEVILQLEETYKYTIVATQDTTLVFVTKARFRECFGNMPRAVGQMKKRYLKNEAPKRVSMRRALSRERGRLRSSVIDGDGGIPPDFPDAILEAFQ